MTSKVVYGFFSGLTLATILLGGQTVAPAFGAELDGFAINTQDKTVTVTLFTDQRVPYTTEHQGRQFTIVLPNAQLSKEQINNGLPVVIDNKNRFIGRAVPGDDGKVKIILPNLPADEYSVSIQQKRPAQSIAAEPQHEKNLKPRPAVKTEPESHFEEVAASFPKPEAKPAATASNRLKLSPAPIKANRGGMWNPYVYRPSDFQKTASKPAAQPAKKSTAHASAPADEPINTVSVAESVQQAFGDSNANQNHNADPLWYLHALPPGNVPALSADNLQGPAAQLPAQSQTVKANPASEKPAPSAIKELAAELRHGFKSLPVWFVALAAVFLGGLGLFSLIGGLVLLKILFERRLLSNQGTQGNAPYLAGVVPLYASPDTSIDFMTGTQGAKSSYASRPSYGQTSLKFEDKAQIQALDYLKNGSSSVSQAVYNTTLVKFPANVRQRSIGRKKVRPL